MFSPEYNLALAQLMLDQIENYVLSSELFWSLGQQAPSGSPPYPVLTIGGLLLTLDQLKVQAEDILPAQYQDYQKVETKLSHAYSKWPVGLENKAFKELSARHNLWRAYITDLEEHNETPENFSREVRNRVIFQRLTEVASKHPDTKSAIKAMSVPDGRLRGFFIRGDFIWDSALQTTYPASTYWFLYGMPKPA